MLVEGGKEIKTPFSRDEMKHAPTPPAKHAVI